MEFLSAKVVAGSRTNRRLKATTSGGSNCFLIAGRSFNAQTCAKASYDLGCINAVIYFNGQLYV